MSNIHNSLASAEANPYRPPAFDDSPAPITPFTRKQSRDRLRWPAIGLISLSILWGAMVAIPLGALLPETLMRLSINSSGNDASVAILVIGLVLLTPTFLMIVGSVQMLRVRGRNWCWVGAITAALPLTPVFPLTLPLGIWGIMILKDPRVGLSFHNEINFHTLP